MTTIHWTVLGQFNCRDHVGINGRLTKVNDVPYRRGLRSIVFKPLPSFTTIPFRSYHNRLAVAHNSVREKSRMKSSVCLFLRCNLSSCQMSSRSVDWLSHEKTGANRVTSAFIILMRINEYKVLQQYQVIHGQCTARAQKALQEFPSHYVLT